MHETGVCRSIVETAERSALAAHAKRVKSVCLQLGEVHDVVPEILVGAFEWMSRGTVVEGARLDIDRVPFTVACQRCGEVFRLDYRDKRTWACPCCQAHDYRLNTGREFSIVSIEVEGFAPGEVDTTAEVIAERARASRARPDARALAVSGRPARA